MSPLELVVTAGSLLATGFTAVTWVRLGRAGPKWTTAQGPMPPVLLLRPVDAPTAQELKNLAHSIDYPGRIDHVVLSPFRPRLPDSVRWVPSDPLGGNRKVGHVAYGLNVLQTRKLCVLVVDADVAVDGELVRSLVAPLQQGAALSVAAPHLDEGNDAGAFLATSLLDHTHHAFRALHATSLGAKAICGKALGLSERAQQVLRSLGEHIGEDLELSQRLHEEGLPVALASTEARVPAAPPRISDALERFTRGMQVRRAPRPRMYPTVPLLLAATPVWTVGALLSGSAAAAAAVSVLWLSRAALSARLARLGGHPVATRTLWRWFPAEVLLLAAWSTSLLRRTVRWRGRRYVIGGHGRMTELPATLPEATTS